MSGKSSPVSDHETLSKPPRPEEFDKAASGTEDISSTGDEIHILAEQFLERNADTLLRQLTAQNSFFTADDVLNALEINRDWKPHILGEKIQSNGKLRDAICDALLTDLSQVLEYEPEKLGHAKGGPNHFTTVELFNQDHQVIRTGKRWAEERGTGSSQEVVTKVIEAYAAERESMGKDPKVDDEVRIASARMLEPKRLGILIGPPGAGKTTLIRLIGDALVNDGHTMLVTTQSGMLSQKLERETGHPALPLSEVIEQMSRVRDISKAPELGLTHGGTLVVDEAAMLGTRQMHQIMQLVSKHKLNLRLIGDPKQIAAASPGAPMEKLLDYIEPAVIDRVVRQSNEVDKQATLNMHAGEAEAALQSYKTRGRLKFKDNAGEVTAKAAKDYAKWRSKPDHDGQHAAILTLDVTSAEQLNSQARERLKQSGYLGPGIEFDTAYGRKEFSTNDRIIFREQLNLDSGDVNSRVYKGSVGTITAINPGFMTVELDGNPNSMIVPIQKQMRIMHAHAMELTQPDPAESPQGSTLTRAFLAVTRSWSAPEAIVGISRHKKKLTVYVNKEVYPDLQSLAADAEKRPQRLTTLDVADEKRAQPTQPDRTAGPG